MGARRGSVVQERRTSVASGGGKNKKKKVQRTLTAKKQLGKYIFAASTEDELQQWKGALLDHYLVRFAPEDLAITAPTACVFCIILPRQC